MRSLFTVALAGLLTLPTTGFGQRKAKQQDPFQHPFANPVDQPGLPRVLIVGDSISIGYTPRVRRLLDGKANVHRPQTNCRWSAYGNEHISEWIGDGKWDVIHFNFGLWDWYGWSQDVKAKPESYAASLDGIVRQLKPTGARLIFGVTTPPCIGPERKVKIVITEKRAQEFNDAARVVMKKHGVAINDLYSAIGRHRGKYQRNENDVHYTEEGRDVLAAKVAKVIAVALPERSAAVRPKLQFINGSKQSMEVFWIKSADERVSNAVVAPGENTIIHTTLGHRFAVVGRKDKTELTVTSEVPVQAFRFDPPDQNGIPAFYTQRMSAKGFPIVASSKVNPYALKEAVYLANMMLAKRPDVREAMIKSGARLSILAWNEFTIDQPEWKWLAKHPVPGFPGISPRDYRDARARGMGGSLTDPFCSCAEENLLGYEGDPYSKENIFIHEFAHNIHLRGMSNVDPGFDRRVKKTYDAAMKAGLWKGKYAAVNHHEYFAEGVQSWFDDNRENDHDHNHVNTRAELIEYDPGLADLCREVFGDTVLKYTKPVTRLHGHLKGYDPAKAPEFVWPERLEQARRKIRAAARARSRAATGK